MRNSLWLVILLAACSTVPERKVNIIDRDTNVVTPPNCPNWTKTDGNGGSNYYNTSSSNFGCSSVTNFGAMLEDPNDLILGKSTHLTNSAKTAAAINGYESGPSSAGALASPSSSSPSSSSGGQ